MKETENYFFHVFLSDTDYNRVAYSDFEKEDNVKVYWQLNPNKSFLKYIQRFHCHGGINRIIRIPFKSIWFKRLIDPRKITETNRICFVFMYTWVNGLDYIEFIQYLHRHFPHAKYVCYYNDIISSLSPKAIVRDFESIKKYFNLFVTYDKRDAERYGMSFFPTSFSNYIIPNDKDISSTDILFLGAAKNRWEKILSVYRFATSIGLSCDFYIYKLPYEQQIILPGIHYIEEPMHYEDYLKYVKKCKCILEIEQTGAQGATLRNWEAINYDKFLLTDNASIVNTEFYDSNYVFFVRDDGSFEGREIQKKSVYYNPLKEKIRPKRFLEFIEKKFEE